jgi:SAM-dependent methyltransferase
MSMNVQRAVVENFGREWAAFDQSAVPDEESRRLFQEYFSLFDFSRPGEGFDIGCGSGRWARLLAPRVRYLHCIDPSDAIEVARRNLAGQTNVAFHRACIDDIPLPDGSQDFACAIGVLHHVPDPEAAMRACVGKLRPGGQFLVYLYYRFDNRPRWFKALWKVADQVRRGISSLPFGVQRAAAEGIAALVYWPLARAALLLHKLRIDVEMMPLSAYRDLSFYTMRTDALDRFGTRLEKRFTRDEVAVMMRASGLGRIRFRDAAPYWVASGVKR